MLDDADQPEGGSAACAASMVASSSSAEDARKPTGRQHRALAKRLGLRPADALICVDVQRDFLPGGSLAVGDGAAILRPMNAYMAAFAAKRLPIFLSRDWHPPDHCSFRHMGGAWPAHCVQHTRGADWPAELQIPPGARIISKASDRTVEAYSAFTGTPLLVLLRSLDVRRVFVGGLATEYCVNATVMDALTHGFQVVVLADAIRPVDALQGDGERAIAAMLERGATLFQSTRERSPSTPQEA